MYLIWMLCHVYVIKRKKEWTNVIKSWCDLFTGYGATAGGGVFKGYGAKPIGDDVLKILNYLTIINIIYLFIFTI